MYNPTRLKVQLKLAINRLKMLQAKKNSLNQHQRREIATLLEKGKEESARIRVEHIIREDLVMEAMEILELYCDLLLARFGLIDQYKNCDPGIAEAVHTIIWAAPRADEVKELGSVRDQLGWKYGKEFVLRALDNTDDLVNARVMSKFQVSAPESFLVERYLEEIAKSYDVRWVSDILKQEDHQTDDDSDGNGGLKEPAEAQLEPPLLADLLGAPAKSSTPASVEPENNKQIPSLPSPTLDLPEIPSNTPVPRKPTSASAANNSDDFDALAKRLEALKRK
ncbi:hypothetical protein EC973_008829 [Apophysomyces ossiformis]|uniref:DUF292-domain-containing protein n=1 Tax=Apophysomyces ossiformis TaxID=679940 RepID=A0A8H7BYI5_9FUNG|nr:hypothetical protein EC973_008829 [Apophysomyces ossiformis]